MRRHAALIMVGALALTAPMGTSAQAQDEAVFKDKTLRLIVGGAAGGGFDTYARLIARVMTNHLPGKPTIIVANMPGAGGTLAATNIYTVAPKDGTVFAAVLPGTITDPLLQSRDKVNYDPAKLIYLGSANSEVNMCFARTDTGVTSIRDLQTRELIIGASAEGGSTRDQAVIQRNVLGTKFKIVFGYPGSREILLAMEKGEVQGICGLGLPAFRQQRADWLESGFARIISQDNVTGDPKITAQGVPRTVELARSDDDRKVLELLYSQQKFGRPYILPPDVPADRVAILRRAFAATLADPELLAAAEKAKIDITPVSGEELQTLVGKAYATPPDLVEKAKAALLEK